MKTNRSTTARLGLLVAIMAFSAGHAWTPMEPARKTLIILAHGINPPQGSLFRPGLLGEKPKGDGSDYRCSDESGNAHIWRTHKMSPFLRDSVAGAYHLIYAQGFSEANNSPVFLAHELGDRHWSLPPDKRHCEGRRMIRKIKGNRIDTASISINTDLEMKSFFEQATRRWFEGEILEYENVHERGNPVGSGDPEVQVWIDDFRSTNGGTYPDLGEMRADPVGRRLVPARFIVIAHSMGGLTTREYLHSDFYQGDVDKIITLDTPHEGSFATPVNRELFNPDFFKNFLVRAQFQMMAQLAIGSTTMILSNNKFVDAAALYYLEAALSSWLAESFVKIMLTRSIANGYGYEDSANIYMIPGSRDLARINSFTGISSPVAGNGYPIPAFRIFHNEGVISPGDPEDLVGSNFLMGAVIPKALDGILRGLFSGATTDYVQIGNFQRWGNAFLASVLASMNINFTNQGTVVVNAKSSRGDDVALFNMSTTDTKRHLFSIEKPYLNTPEELMFKIAYIYGKSKLEKYYALKALNWAAGASNQPWLKTTKFPIAFLTTSLANYAVSQTMDKMGVENESIKLLVAGGLLDFVDVAHIDTIVSSHDYATINSRRDRIETPRLYSISGLEKQETANPTLIEDFLYEKPYAGLATERAEDGTIRVGIGAGDSLEAGSTWGWAESSLVSVNASSLREIDYNAAGWQDKMALKEESYEEIGGTGAYVRRVKRYMAPDGMATQNIPEQFNFIVDDLRPDLMRSISVTFNYNRFSISIFRKASGRYGVLRKAAGEGWDSLPDLDICPIDARGNWRLRPRDFLDSGSNLSRVFEDGQNTISVSFVNHAGYFNSQRFFLLFQATPPIVNVLWPRLFATLSNPRPVMEVDFYTNYYPGLVLDKDATYFKIYPLDAGDSAVSESYFDGIPPGSDEPLHFTHSWLGGDSIAGDGAYWLKVEAKTQIDSVTAGGEIGRVPFTLDRQPPVFSWNLGDAPFKSDSKALLRYSWRDSVSESVEGVRICMYNAATGALVWEFQPYGAASSRGGSVVLPDTGLPQGAYEIVVEGRDPAVPDRTAKAQVDSLMAAITARQPGPAADAVLDAVWSAMKTRTLPGSARPAYNFGAAADTFFIDDHPPVIGIEGFKALVNLSRSQEILYKLADNSAGWRPQVIHLKWKFTRTAFGARTAETFVYETRDTIDAPGIAQAPVCSLRESAEGFKLPEGHITFAVEVKDAAGNRNEYTSPSWEFTVDRTPPNLKYVLMRSATYKSGDTAAVDFHLDEVLDDPENQTARFGVIGIGITSPTGLYTEDPYVVTDTGSFTHPLSVRLDEPGLWSVAVTAADGAGNSVERGDAFYVDREKTEIVSPDGSSPVWGKVAVYGTAGDPMFNMYDFHYYELSWRHLDSAQWHSEFITVPGGSQGGGPANRSYHPRTLSGILGYWDVRTLPAVGGYMLRLESYENGGPAVARDSVEVYLAAGADSLDFSAEISGIPAPDTAFVPGSGNFGFDIKITSNSADFKFENAYREAAYTAAIVIKDSRGKVLYDKSQPGLRASIFEGKPASQDSAGYYLWYGSGGKWHLDVREAPESAQFTVSYSADGWSPFNCREAVCDGCRRRITCDTLAVAGQSFTLPNEGEIPVNRMLMISVPEGKSGHASFVIPEGAGGVFGSGKALSISDSPVADSLPFLDGRYFFAGSGARRIYFESGDSSGMQLSIPVFGIRSRPSSFHGTWNGFLQNASFPAPGTATIRVDVHPDDGSGGRVPSMTQVRTAEAHFEIELPGIEVAAQGSGSEFLFDPDDNVAPITFTYGLSGRDALLTAGIRFRSGGKVLKTFFMDKPHKAFNDIDKYWVSWNGMSDLNHAASDKAALEFFLLARDSAAGVVEDSAAVSFTVRYTKWGPAPDFLFTLDIADDEKAPYAWQTSADATAVVPRPKYRVDAKVSGQVFDLKTFSFRSVHHGRQDVIAYPDERFNVLLQRKRETISFNLVLMLRGQQYGIGHGAFNCGSIVEHPDGQTEDGLITGDGISIVNYFNGLPITISKGQTLRIPFDFQVKTGDYEYFWDIADDRYAADLQRFLYIRILPSDVWVNPGTIGDERNFFPETDAYLAAFDRIQLWEDQIIYNGQFHSGGPDFFFEPSPPHQTCLIDSLRDFNENPDGTMDNGDVCLDGNKFDPHSNIVHIGLDFYNTESRSSFKWNRAGETTCLQPGFKNVGFYLVLKVPDEYWDSPFGYNNLANRCMRFDSKNLFLYSPTDGYFLGDDYNNNLTGDSWETGNRRSDNQDDVFNKFLNPFVKQGFVWRANYSYQTVTNGIITDSLRFKQFKHDFDHPLSFANNDQNHVQNDKLIVGFQGEPATLGAHYEFTIEEQEGWRPYSETFPISYSAIKHFRVVTSAVQWSHADTITLSERFVNESSFYKVFNFKNYHFGLRMRARPADFVNERNLNIAWPATEELVNAYNASGTGYKIFLGVSGIRWGIDDGITEDPSTHLPIYLTRMPFVDSTGYFTDGLDPDMFPASVQSRYEFILAHVDTLDETGHALDDTHFDPGFHDFGTNVIIDSVGIDWVTPGIGWERMGNTMLFSGNVDRPWDGSQDVLLARHDLDQDGRLGEQEDRAGRISAVLEWPKGRETERLALREQLYLGSAPTGTGDSASMYIFNSGSGVWEPNPKLADLALDSITIRYLDDTAHTLISGMSGASFPGHLTGLDSITLNRAHSWDREKELITIMGKAVLPYSLAYLDNKGKMVPFKSGPGDRPPSGLPRVLGYLNANELQGNTTLFLYQKVPAYDSIWYKKLNVIIGNPVSSDSDKIVTSIYGDASVQFLAGVMPGREFITVRVTNIWESGLWADNRLSVVGPVVEVLPHMNFDGSEPRVRIRITRDELTARSVDIRNVLIHKPDGDSLVPLQHHVYAFYNYGAFACSTSGDWTEVCAAEWDLVEVTAATTSFSHFAALDTSDAGGAYAITLSPEKDINRQRTLIVDGMRAGEYTVFLDDDAYFQDASDSTPAVAAPVIRIIRDQQTLSELIIELGRHGWNTVLVVPTAGNAKLRTVRALWLEPLDFAYSGLPVITLSSASHGTAFPIRVNQPGTMNIALDRNGSSYGEAEFQVEADSAGPVSVFWDGETAWGRLPEGRYTTRLIYRGRDNQNSQLAGPDVIADYSAPVLSLDGSYEIGPDSVAVRLTASVSGEEAIQSESFTVYMGTTTLAAGSFGSDVLIGSKTVEVGFPAAAIAACADCRIEAQFYVLDLAGQLASRTWRSEPISAANHAEYTLSGDFIRRPAYHFQIPVRVRNTSLPSFFFNSAPEGADVYFLGEDGSRLAHHIERFDAAAGEAVFWVAVPEILPGRDVNLTMHWADSVLPPVLNEDDESFLANYHFNRNAPSRDASRNALDLGLHGAQPVSGVIGDGAYFNGASYFESDTAYALPPIQSFGVSAWIQPAAAPGGAMALVSRGNAGSEKWRLGLSDSLIEFSVGGQKLSHAFHSIANGQWNHVAALYDPQASPCASILVNGEILASGDINACAAPDTGAALAAVGRQAGTEAGYFTGRMDEVRISWLAQPSDRIRLEYETQRHGSRALFHTVAQRSPPTWARWINIDRSDASFPGNVDLRKFPLKIELDESVYPYIRTDNGANIGFADRYGHYLPFQVDYWDVFSGKAAVWVPFPHYPGRSQHDRIAFLFSPAASFAGNSPPNAWNNHTLGAWHFSPGKYRDEGTGGWPRAAMDGPTDYYGAIGDGLEFVESGESYHVTGGPEGLNLKEGFTVEAWYYVDAPEDLESGGSRILSLSGARHDDVLALSLESAREAVSLRIMGRMFEGPENSVEYGKWRHVTASADLRTGELDLYQDGELLTHFSATPLAWLDADGGNFTIGSHESGDPAKDFHGLVDEVRLHGKAYGADWVRFNYQTQALHNTQLAFGDKTRFTTDFFEKDPYDPGLIARYRFQPGLLETVFDVSEFSDPFDLYLRGEGAYMVNGGGVGFRPGDHNTLLLSQSYGWKMVLYPSYYSQLSVEAWVEPADLADGVEKLIIGYVSEDSAGRENWGLYQNGADISFHLRSSNGDPVVYTTTSRPLYATDRKFHLVASYSPYSGGMGGLKLYVDGELAGSFNETGTFHYWADNAWGADYQLAVGNHPASLARDWDGRIFEAAVYSQALSPSKVLENYLKSELRVPDAAERYMLGVYNPHRLLPAAQAGGAGPWTEDIHPDGTPLMMNGKRYDLGIGGQPGAGGAVSWLLYDLQDIRRQLDAGDVQLVLAGTAGAQDGGSGAIILIKTSGAETMPAEAEWEADTGGVSERLRAEGAVLPFNLDISGDRWLWLGLRSASGASPFCNFGDIHIELRNTAGRPQPGLQALYIFDEGSGGDVRDVSGAGIPLNLRLTGGGAAWRSGGGMQFSPAWHHANLENRTPNSKIFHSCTRSNELTVEAWLTPADFDPVKHKHIISFQDGTAGTGLNFVVMQLGHKIGFFLRTKNSADQGIFTSGEPLVSTTEVYHVVAGYKPFDNVTGAGGMRIYINGVLKAHNYEAGPFYGDGGVLWDKNHVLSIGNRPGNLDWGWNGALYAAAVYNRYFGDKEAGDAFRRSVPSAGYAGQTYVGMGSPDKFRPFDLLDGYRVWKEDATADNRALKMGNISYPYGIGGQPLSDGSVSWMAYDIGAEAGRLGLRGDKLLLTGFGGKQDGSGIVSVFVKTSAGPTAPSAADWRDNQNGVFTRFTAVDAAAEPLNLDITEAKWLWVGQSAPSAGTNGHGIFGDLNVVDVSWEAGVNGLNYDYYEGCWNELPDFESLDPVKRGTIQGFELSPRRKPDCFAFRFRGFIDIARAGYYTFYLVSDDGSSLSIDGEPVVDNDGCHVAMEKSGTVYLYPGRHAIEARYFEKYGSEGLKVSYAGPGLAKSRIPEDILFPEDNSAQEFLAGLAYKYYEGSWSSIPDFDAMAPVKSGVTASVSLAERQREDHFGFSFNGFLKIESEGEYTFYLSSDDGSKLYINGMKVVDNDGCHGTIEKSGTIYLETGYFPLKAEYFESSGGQEFILKYKGPGIPKGAIPAHQLFHTPEQDTTSTSPSGKVEFRYYETGCTCSMPEFSALTPVSSGTFDSISLSPRTRNDNFGFVFMGQLDISTAGDYTFYTTSDDGSLLYMDGQLVVNNDGCHGAQERSGVINLSLGTHTIEVRYFDNSGSESLIIQYSAPAVVKREVF